MNKRKRNIQISLISYFNSQMLIMARDGPGLEPGAKNLDSSLTAWVEGTHLPGLSLLPDRVCVGRKLDQEQWLRTQTHQCGVQVS